MTSPLPPELGNVPDVGVGERFGPRGPERCIERLNTFIFRFDIELEVEFKTRRRVEVNGSYECRTIRTRSDGCNAPYGIEERHRALVSCPVSTIDGEKGAKKSEMEGKEVSSWLLSIATENIQTRPKGMLYTVLPPRDADFFAWRREAWPILYLSTSEQDHSSR